MTTPLPRYTTEQIKLMPNGALLIRVMEAARRLERMPHAQWLQERYHQAADEFLYRRQLGRVSPGLCGIADHILRPYGGIHPCDCEDT
jgi:hypothetical protein